MQKKGSTGRLGLCTRARRPGYLLRAKKVARPSRPVYQGGTPWLPVHDFSRELLLVSIRLLNQVFLLVRNIYSIHVETHNY